MRITINYGIEQFVLNIYNTHTLGDLQSEILTKLNLPISKVLFIAYENKIIGIDLGFSLSISNIDPNHSGTSFLTLLKNEHGLKNLTYQGSIPIFVDYILANIMLSISDRMEAFNICHLLREYIHELQRNNNSRDSDTRDIRRNPLNRPIATTSSTNIVPNSTNINSTNIAANSTNIAATSTNIAAISHANSATSHATPHANSVNANISGVINLLNHPLFSRPRHISRVNNNDTDNDDDNDTDNDNDTNSVSTDADPYVETAEFIIDTENNTITPVTHNNLSNDILSQVSHHILNELYHIDTEAFIDVPITITEEEFNIVSVPVDNVSEGNCTICLTPLNNNVRKLIGCNHCFHHNCIEKQLVDFNSRCPTCRYDVRDSL